LSVESLNGTPKTFFVIHIFDIIFARPVYRLKCVSQETDMRDICPIHLGRVRYTGTGGYPERDYVIFSSVWAPDYYVWYRQVVKVDALQKEWPKRNPSMDLNFPSCPAERCGSIGSRLQLPQPC